MCIDQMSNSNIESEPKFIEKVRQKQNISSSQTLESVNFKKADVDIRHEVFRSKTPRFPTKSLQEDD